MQPTAHIQFPITAGPTEANVPSFPCSRGNRDAGAGLERTAIADVAHESGTLPTEPPRPLQVWPLYR